MNWTPAEKVADAVLHEGYLLYPYRASALKNRRRWTFGRLAPGQAAATEFLLDGGLLLSAKVRFFQELGGAIELREAEVDDLRDGRRAFAFPPLAGALRLASEPAGPGRRKLALRIENAGREGALLSCHVLLAVEGGAFLSMTDPAAAACRHEGLWPVRVREGLLLASPILLPDFPAVAPESPRDLFDATEIDEILTLRILTLTDAEKEELRRGDPRARRLLERTEALSREELLALHGGRRAPVRAGDRVRLRPQGRADILDLALAGKEAVVVAVEEDLEGRRYVAVTVEGDPGGDLGRQGYPGHRFFFRPEEVELL